MFYLNQQQVIQLSSIAKLVRTHNRSKSIKQKSKLEFKLNYCISVIYTIGDNKKI